MDVTLFPIPFLNKLNENMTEIKNEIFQTSDMLNQINFSILDLLHMRIGDVKIKSIKILFENLGRELFQILLI